MKAHQRSAAMRAAGVHPAAAAGPRWIWGANAIEDAAEALAALPRPLVLIGEAKLVGPMRKRLSQAWIESGIEMALAEFPEGAECTFEQAQRLAGLAKSRNAGTLVGLGGGKCLDSVKWAGKLAGLPVVTLPTSAATCACATAVVVAHGTAGEVLELVDLESPPKICIVDLKALASAPERLLRAGRADTLAKWLEWSAVETPEGEGGEAAHKAYLAASGSPEPEELLDACLRLSATASNLGQAPAAAAHSFCAGMSLLPGHGELLHGEWVSLGLMFQERLAAAGDTGLEKLLHGLGLPVRLPFKLDDAARMRALERILAGGESIHLLPEAGNFSPATLAEILRSLEP